MVPIGTPGQTLAEGGNDRLKEKNLITEDGYDQTRQGQTVAARRFRSHYRVKPLPLTVPITPQVKPLPLTVPIAPRVKPCRCGSDRTPGQTLAEGGGDRVIERNSATS